MTEKTRRPYARTVGLGAALAASAAVLALSGVVPGRATEAAPATQETAHVHEQAARSISPQELALRQGMRKLWEDHANWTRLAVIGLTTGSPDTKAAVGRLLKNQDDIGKAIVPFYGADAGRKLTGLLRQHILIAADVVAAAKSGKANDLATQQARWRANGDDIAAFLAAANPKSWPLDDAKVMMRRHLDLTTAEVVARLKGDWEGDVKAADAVHNDILGMADMLSSGIVRQFPARFR